MRSSFSGVPLGHPIIQLFCNKLLLICSPWATLRQEEVRQFLARHGFINLNALQQHHVPSLQSFIFGAPEELSLGLDCLLLFALFEIDLAEIPRLRLESWGLKDPKLLKISRFWRQCGPRSPLLLAAKKGYVRMVALLLRAGADQSQKTSKGRTLLEVAQQAPNEKARQQIVAMVRGTQTLRWWSWFMCLSSNLFRFPIAQIYYTPVFSSDHFSRYHLPTQTPHPQIRQRIWCSIFRRTRSAKQLLQHTSLTSSK